MIRADHITKKFGSLSVLSNVSFEVHKGQIYGLIGYNGVGKTTLLKILCGIYRPDLGEAMINDEKVYENQQIKRKCFFMTEEAAFFDQASLKQMRKFYAGYYPAWSDKTFEGLVEWFGVDPDEKISRFSKGMQRQASLILAFSTRPEYLFLDEAFDGLDYTMRKQVSDMFRHYAKVCDAAILITSHNLKELENLADHIGLLNDGVLTFNDSTDRMKEEYQTCIFSYKGSADRLDIADMEILEKKIGQEGTPDTYYCIVRGSEKTVAERIKDAGAENLQMHPVQLEEFFRKERKEREVDWDEIFG